MAKGRPPLEPRIANLEARILELEQEIADLRGRTERIPERHPAYVAAFDKWPGKTVA
jgi:hypothetical protein